MNYDIVFTESNATKESINAWMDEVEARAKERDWYTVSEGIVIGRKATETFCQVRGLSFPDTEPYGEQLENRSQYEDYTAYEVRCWYEPKDGSKGARFTCDAYVVIEVNGYYLMPESNNRYETTGFTIMNAPKDLDKYLTWDNFRKDWKAPNKAKVLETHIVDRWFAYLKKQLNVYDREKLLRGDKVRLFLDRINSLDKSQYEVFEVDVNSGTLERNNLRYGYEIKDGVISESLELVKKFYMEDEVSVFSVFEKMNRGRYRSETK